MKKLIIVCEDKLRKFGDFLAQLVSLEDDKDGTIRGTRDGAVAAQVWTEKDYAGNAAQISSEQYILFVGNSKLAKEKRTHMLVKYSDYGMEYGWLGKQAALCVNKNLEVDEYMAFIEFAQGHQTDVKQLVEKIDDVLVIEPEEIETDEKHPTIKKFLNPMKAIPAVIVNAPGKGINAINMLANNKKIESQQYTCAIMLFYLNGLSEFLGL